MKENENCPTDESTTTLGEVYATVTTLCCVTRMQARYQNTQAKT